MISSSSSSAVAIESGVVEEGNIENMQGSRSWGPELRNTDLGELIGSTSTDKEIKIHRIKCTALINHATAPCKSFKVFMFIVNLLLFMPSTYVLFFFIKVLRIKLFKVFMRTVFTVNLLKTKINVCILVCLRCVSSHQMSTVWCDMWKNTWVEKVRYLCLWLLISFN